MKTSRFTRYFNQKFFLAFIFLLTACNPGINSFSVPDTNFKVSVPSDWVRLNAKELRISVREGRSYVDVPQEYIDSLQAIDREPDIELYFFVKPLVVGDGSVLTNFQILTMNLHGQSVLLEEVLEGHKNQISTFPGITNLESDRCPKMVFEAYRCLMLENNFANIPILQYVYFLIDSDRLVTMPLTFAPSENYADLSNIISSIKR